ncbi:MAG TPA: molybdenum cofactor guanylyltransferase [Candidatus Polarisedimenticolia bacterium]|nr:molybdenum cofactor guanylyltransferase [Candidatus Polarisedimenticolia bacterium]
MLGGVWRGLVFAGGTSRRMGRDKALLPLGGATLLERSVALVRAAGGEALVVAPPRPGYAAAGAPVIDDTAEGGGVTGPLGALRHGLRLEGAERVVVVACDLPLLPAELLRLLAAEAQRYDAVVPRAGGELQVLAAAYTPACLPAIEAHLLSGRRSVHGFLERVRVRILEETDLSPFGGAGIFLNVNSPEDLRRAEAILARRTP